MQSIFEKTWWPVVGAGKHVLFKRKRTSNQGDMGVNLKIEGTQGGERNGEIRGLSWR